MGILLGAQESERYGMPAPGGSRLCVPCSSIHSHTATWCHQMPDGILGPTPSFLLEHPFKSQRKNSGERGHHCSDELKGLEAWDSLVL